MGGQLTIRAPNSKMPRVTDDSPLEDRVNYILYNEVNPGLASHGGKGGLGEITDDNFAVWRFGGGWQGWGAEEMTLKKVVEVGLRRELPERQGILDVTDHSDRTNAYI